MARLEIRGIDVRFGSVPALRQVDLSAEAGAVTGLIGPAGAGKTTVFNVITGQQKPQAGTVVLDGQDVTSLPPHRRARLGIARTFERLEVFGSLTVRENILVAAEMRRRWSRDGANTRKVADDVMEELGLRALSRERCDGLPPGLARLVEVGRALATRPSVLLLDEPSVGLDAEETEELAGALGRLADRDLAVVLVEDDTAPLAGICRTVHLLDGGQVVAVGTPAELCPTAVVRTSAAEARLGDHRPAGALA